MSGFVAIVNPAAGSGRCGKRAPAALAELERRGLRVDSMHRTTRPGHATELAKAAWAGGARRFLAVGGDGTAHEILQGVPIVANADDPPVIGMLPLGTGNSYLRDFGITGARAALDALARGDEHPSDVVRLTHDDGVVSSFNIVGLGFSAEVGALTNRRYKPLGALGYVISVFITAARLRAPAYPLRLDGGPLDPRPATLLSFCNSQCTAGTMRMAPHAAVSDGKLDVIRIAPMRRLPFVAAFPSIFAGQHVARPEVEETRASRVDFEVPEAVDCMIDGEILCVRPRTLEVIPSAMRVVA